jgi:undecaprenyl-diphosphatase
MAILRAVGRRTAIEVLTLVLAAVALGAVFSAVGAALRHQSPRAERLFMKHLDGGPHAILTTVSKVLSFIGSQGVLVPVAIAACVLLVLRRHTAIAVVVAASTAGSIVLSNVVKLIVGRPRPALPHLAHVTSSSFPSGHATQSAAILLALALAAAALGAPRALAFAVAAAGALAIGTSRVLLGVHYPSDVIAGWVLGLAWFAAVYFVIVRDWPRRNRRSVPAGAR